MAKKIKKSGIAHATGFLPSLIIPKIIHGCQEFYHKETRRIETSNGWIVADLSPPSIARVFGIPSFAEMEVCSKEYDLSGWKTNPKGCVQVIIKKRMHPPRPSVEKLPKKLYRSNFVAEVNDFTMLLSRVVRLPISNVFE